MFSYRGFQFYVDVGTLALFGIDDSQVERGFH